MDDKVNNLKTFGFFKDLKNEDLKVIAQAVSEKEFDSNTIIIEQETEPDITYFLVSGSVRIYRITQEGTEVNLSICGPGEVIGEMAFVDGGVRSANVETLAPSKFLTLAGGDFKNLMTKYPDIAYQLILILTNRVRKLGEFMEESMSQKLPHRTWHVLEILSKYFPNGEITLSQEELSNVVGGTRARVTEILDNLQTEGKIELSHKKIKVL